MKGIAAVAAVGGLPAGAFAARPADIIRFLAVSSELTGITLDRSYMELGEAILSLLTLDGDARMDSLTRAVSAGPGWEDRLAAAGLDPTARAVLTAWYQGTVEIAPQHFGYPAVVRLFGDLAARTDPARPGEPLTVLVTYDEAVVWRSCDFTKPSATCGGHFGYWQDPA
jgi:Membrane bound FAD containing D-sorbitol dehydrogenase.